MTFSAFLLPLQAFLQFCFKKPFNRLTINFLPPLNDRLEFTIARAMCHSYASRGNGHGEDSGDTLNLPGVHENGVKELAFTLFNEMLQIQNT